ncbi:plasmid replication-relaxation protein [Bacillus phage Silence]|nr:plasmid replication-relaxation protein [Bacillus phage Silence]
MEKILSSLKMLGIVSRSQLQIICELGSTRSAFRALDDVKEYVNKFREGENMYYLNAEGRKLVGSKKVIKKMTTAMHYIMRNDLYIAFGCPHNWKNEQRIKVGKINVISDAYFEHNGIINIIEVDHKQKMAANKIKIAKYREIFSNTKKDVRFTWITLTEYRKQQILELSDGLNVNVFLASDFH